MYSCRITESSVANIFRGILNGYFWIVFWSSSFWRLRIYALQSYQKAVILRCINQNLFSLIIFQRLFTPKDYFTKKTFTFLQLKHVNRKLECHLNWWMLSSILWKDLIIWEAITLERKCDHTVYCCSEIPYSFAPKLWDLLPNSNKVLPYLS